MYGIFADIHLDGFRVNVGIYSIHGVFGCLFGLPA